MRVVKGLIQTVSNAAGVIMKFAGLGVADESFNNQELFQHYGFSSRPPDVDEDSLEGVENIVLISRKGKVYSVAEVFKEHEPSKEKGETVIWTWFGDKIHIKNDRTIEINAKSKVIINTKEAKVNATTSAKVVSPIVELGSGITGTLMKGTFRPAFNGHVHPETGGPTTGAPTVPSPASDETVGTKAS